MSRQGLADKRTSGTWLAPNDQDHALGSLSCLPGISASFCKISDQKFHRFTERSRSWSSGPLSHTTLCSAAAWHTGANIADASKSQASTAEATRRRLLDGAANQVCSVRPAASCEPSPCSSAKCCSCAAMASDPASDAFPPEPRGLPAPAPKAIRGCKDETATAPLCGCCWPRALPAARAAVAGPASRCTAAADRFLDSSNDEV